MEELLVKNREATLPPVNNKDFKDMLEVRVYDDIILWCNLENGVFYMTTEAGLRDRFYRPISRAKYIRLAEKFDRAGKKFMMAQTFESLGTATVIAPNGDVANPLFNQYLQRYTCQTRYDADAAVVYYRMSEQEFLVAEYLNTRNNEINEMLQKSNDEGKPTEVPTVTLTEITEKTGLTEDDVRLTFKRLEALEYRPYLALAVVS